MKSLLASFLLVFSVSAIAQQLPVFPHAEGAPYYYFLCNATGWSLNEQTQLQCDDAQCISQYLDYEVKETWMVRDRDSCKLLKTAQLGQWGGDSQVIGAYVDGVSDEARQGPMQVPGVARLFGRDEIRIQYPTVGHYRIWLTRARSAFSIQPLISE